MSFFQQPASWLSLASNPRSDYSVHMLAHLQALSSDELRDRLRPFCEKHRIRRLEVFGSAASGMATPSSDVDLLVTLDESTPVSTSELLEVAEQGGGVDRPPCGFCLASIVREVAEPLCARAHFGYRRVLVWKLINSAGYAIF